MKQFQYLIVMALFVLSLMAVEKSYAATFTVTNTNDSGAGSLRQAVRDANVNNQEDTIVFDTAVFSSPQTIVLTTGQLTILPDNSSGNTKTLTIKGAGANLLTISGNNQSRVITIERNANVIISSLKITNGNGVGGTDYGGNETSGPGGAIMVYPGEGLILKDSIISENKASRGGGLFLAGTTTIINTTISDNSADFGGGVSISGSNVNIINSTVSNNTSFYPGGGFTVYYRCRVYLTNSTIAFNKTESAFGGGIYNLEADYSDSETVKFFRTQNSRCSLYF